MQNIDRMLIEMLIGKMDWILVENIDLILMGY